MLVIVLFEYPPLVLIASEYVADAPQPSHDDVLLEPLGEPEVLAAVGSWVPPSECLEYTCCAKKKRRND